MPKDEKKNWVTHNGNKVYQTGVKFIDEFNEWRDNCLKIGAGDLKVKHIQNLYQFLKNHFKDKYIRKPGKSEDSKGSRNLSFAGEGVNTLLNSLEKTVDDDLFDTQTAETIVALSNVLAAYKDTGEDAGGSGIAADPAFILFTEKRFGRAGQRLADSTVQGHYATSSYADKYGVEQAEDEWLSGNNPPHQALYSETETKFAKPRGLYHIMKDAKDSLPDIENEVIIENTPSNASPEDYEKIGEIEKYFNKVIRNKSFWEDGRLLTRKVRQDFQNQTFELKRSDQEIIREFARLGAEKDEDSIYGKVTRFKMSGTALPIIILVDRALKRANTNKAPDGYRAWQNDRQGGFDYRERGNEEVIFNVNSVRVAKQLAEIPQIKRFAQELLRKTSLYDEEDFRTSQAGNLLAEKKFDFPPAQKKKVLEIFGKENSNPKTIQFKFTKSAMKVLLNQSVISRTRDLQSMNAPNTDKKIVLKAMWQQILWRD